MYVSPVPCMPNALYVFSAAQVSIVISPVDTNVRNENDTLLVVCVAVGYPELSIYWSLDGDPIENGSRVIIYDNDTLAGQHYLQSFLEVCSVSVMDAGLYECTATNGLVNSSSNFTVTVGGKLSVYLFALKTLSPILLAGPLKAHACMSKRLKL